ncbi:MAG: MATE family efflux transporter [Alkalispirochaetaceae bacterium]
MSNKEHGSDRLGTEPVGRLLFSMALPATVAMAVNALYNLVDTIFIGRGVGPLAIGGVGVAFPIQILILAVALLVGIGSASVISRMLGQGDRERAARIVGNALVMIFILSGTLALGVGLFLEEVLRLVGATDELLPFAREYLLTILPGAPFLATSIAANHIVRAEGRAKTSMLIMLVGAVLNIILDPIFIFVLDLGVTGAALATVIAQFISFLVAIGFYLTGRSALPVKATYLRLDRQLTREVAALGLAPFVRQFGQSLFIIIVNNALRSFGDDLAISAFGVINKLLIFALMPLIGISHGFQPIAGYNYGARRMSRVRRVVKLANIVAVSISFFYFAMVMLFPRAIFSAFTSDPELIEIGSFAMRIVLIAVPLIGMQIIGAVFFQAVGKAVPSFILSTSRQILLLIPLVLILPRIFGVVGVWAAFPAADVAATILTLLWLRREMRKLHILGCVEEPELHNGCPDPEDSGERRFYRARRDRLASVEGEAKGGGVLGRLSRAWESIR